VEKVPLSVFSLNPPKKGGLTVRIIEKTNSLIVFPPFFFIPVYSNYLKTTRFALWSYLIDVSTFTFIVNAPAKGKGSQPRGGGRGVEILHVTPC